MTVEDNTKVEVRSLVGHSTGYVIPELHIKRHFEPFETKRVEAGELRELHYRKGGRIILHEYLSVQNDELRHEFDIPSDQVEYDWTEQDIRDLLLNGDEDALRDAIDFGPAGVVEQIKRTAFELKIPDVNKREIIKDMTGTDVNKQIELKKEEELRLAESRGETSGDKETKQRRHSNEEPTKRRRRVAQKTE